MICSLQGTIFSFDSLEMPPSQDSGDVLLNSRFVLNVK
jgi:hypothetical protein